MLCTVDSGAAVGAEVTTAARIGEVDVSIDTIIVDQVRCGSMSQKCGEIVKGRAYCLRSSKTSVAQCGLERIEVLAECSHRDVKRLENSIRFAQSVV